MAKRELTLSDGTVVERWWTLVDVNGCFSGVYNPLSNEVKTCVFVFRTRQQARDERTLCGGERVTQMYVAK